MTEWNLTETISIGYFVLFISIKCSHIILYHFLMFNCYSNKHPHKEVGAHNRNVIIT